MIPYVGATEKYSTTKECQRKAKPTTRGNKHENEATIHNKITQVRHLQELRKEHRNKGHLEWSVAIATLVSFQREGCLKVVWECRLGVEVGLKIRDAFEHCR